MRILLLSLFLAACGSGGSVPANPEPFNTINLFGSWQLTLTIPECDRKFVSMYYVTVRRDSDVLLSRISSLGEYPDLKNVAACNSIVIPDMVDLNPYTTSSTYVQFKEFLSLRLLWDYDGIDIVEYSNNLIAINRTIQTPTGERLWSYRFDRKINPYIPNKRYDVSLLTASILSVKGCGNTYNHNFLFSNDGQYMTTFKTSNETPIFSPLDPCATSQSRKDVYQLPAFYRSKTLALEFRTVMQGVWPSIVILSWFPDEVRFVRTQGEFILGYQFPSTLKKQKSTF